MKQVLIIHGGNSFSTYRAYRLYLESKDLNYEKLIQPRRWKDKLADSLPGYDVIHPSMPNSLNAVYDEWVIYFEKLLKFLDDDAQIIGHSLGAMFLAKYLNEKPLSNPVEKLILVSGGYNDNSNEDLGSFEVRSATKIPQSAREVHLFHSEDDPVVPYAELNKFQSDMPNAIVHSFSDRGHFLQTDFPELTELIKNNPGSGL